MLAFYNHVSNTHSCTHIHREIWIQRERINNQEHNSQDKCELSSFVLLALLKYIEQSDRVQISLITSGTFLKTQAKYENKENSVVWSWLQRTHKLAPWIHTQNVRGEKFFKNVILFFIILAYLPNVEVFYFDISNWEKTFKWNKWK